MSVKIQSEVEKFVQERSNDPTPRLEFNSKHTRFGSRRKRFFFIGHSNIYKTTPYFVGFVLDWFTGDKATFKDFNEELYKIDQEYKRAIYKGIKKLETTEKRSFGYFIEGLEDAKTHPYLVQKGVQGYGVKEVDDALIVPATSWETGNIIGYQMIFDKKLTEMGKEYLDVGGRKIKCSINTNKYNVGTMKNTYHQIGDITDSIYVCEGYATAATLHYVTSSTAYSCFGKHSLVWLAKQLATKYKEKKIFIVLDTDCLKKPEEVEGEEKPKSFYDVKKEEVNKSSCFNISFIVPHFSELTPEETDFNDLFGLDEDECRKQILEQSKSVDHIIVLGGDGNKIWISSLRRGLVEVSIAVKKEELLARVAPREFWNKISTNYNVIKAMIQEASLLKDFDISKIKTTGLFQDSKEGIVINTGDKIIGKPKDDVIYLKRGKHDRYTYPDPRDYNFNEEQYAEFVSNVSQFYFQEKEMAYSLIIWLAMTPFFGAQPFVTHLLMQGSSGTGKSWTIKHVIEPYFKRFQLNKISPATTFAAFLRKQQLKQKIFIFDEKEMRLNSDKEDDFLTAIRQVSTDKDYVVEKAETSGSGLRTYMYDFISVLSSIKPIVFREEDKSRFIHLVFSKRKVTQENITSLKNVVSMNLEQLALGVYRYCYDRWDEISELSKEYYTTLTTQHQCMGHPARKMANMLAFGKVLKILSDEEFEEYKKWLIGKEIIDQSDDAEDMLNMIMSLTYNKAGDSITDVISHNFLGEVKTLCDQGVMYEDGKLYISKRSSAINGVIFKPYDPRTNIWFNLLSSKYQRTRKRFYVRSEETRGVVGSYSKVTCVEIPYSIKINPVV